MDDQQRTDRLRVLQEAHGRRHLTAAEYWEAAALYRAVGMEDDARSAEVYAQRAEEFPELSPPPAPVEQQRVAFYSRTAPPMTWRDHTRSIAVVLVVLVLGVAMPYMARVTESVFGHGDPPTARPVQPQPVDPQWATAAEVDRRLPGIVADANLKVVSTGARLSATRTDPDTVVVRVDCPMVMEKLQAREIAIAASWPFSDLPKGVYITVDVMSPAGQVLDIYTTTASGQ